MRQAKVHVSVMGDDAKQKLCLRGLQSAAGFLQTKIAERIDTRYTPRLRFVLDMGVKKSLAIAQLLHDVLPEESARRRPSTTTTRRRRAVPPMTDVSPTMRTTDVLAPMHPLLSAPHSTRNITTSMATPNRASLINRTAEGRAGSTTSRCPPPKDRTLFEHLVFACLRREFAARSWPSRCSRRSRQTTSIGTKSASARSAS